MRPTLTVCQTAKTEITKTAEAVKNGQWQIARVRENAPAVQNHKSLSVAIDTLRQTLGAQERWCTSAGKEVENLTNIALRQDAGMETNAMAMHSVSEIAELLTMHAQSVQKIVAETVAAAHLLRNPVKPSA